MIGAALALTACSGAAERDERPTAGEPAELPIFDELVESLTAADRPTADELKTTIEEELVGTTTGLDAETQDAFLDCISQGLVDSDLSDDLLAKAANNEYGTDDERAEFEDVVTEVSTACVDEAIY